MTKIEEKKQIFDEKRIELDAKKTINESICELRMLMGSDYADAINSTGEYQKYRSLFLDLSEKNREAITAKLMELINKL